MKRSEAKTGGKPEVPVVEQGQEQAPQKRKQKPKKRFFQWCRGSRGPDHRPEGGHSCRATDGGSHGVNCGRSLDVEETNTYGSKWHRGLADLTNVGHDLEADVVHQKAREIAEVSQEIVDVPQVPCTDKVVNVLGVMQRHVSIIQTVLNRAEAP